MMVKKLMRKRPFCEATKRSLFCLRNHVAEVSDSMRSRQTAARRGENGTAGHCVNGSFGGDHSQRVIEPRVALRVLLAHIR